MADHPVTSNKLIEGILTGLAAGAVVSPLVSSKKHRSFGRKLVKKGNSLADELKGKFNEFIDRVEDKFKGILK